jgi:hypothetical protein
MIFLSWGIRNEKRNNDEYFAGLPIVELIDE